VPVVGKNETRRFVSEEVVVIVVIVDVGGGDIEADGGSL